MISEPFTNDPSRLPQNVTGWIEVTDSVRESYQFEHGSVWLMAVPVHERHDLKSWYYEMGAVTVDCDGPLQLECDGVPWAWELEDVAYMVPLRK